MSNGFHNAPTNLRDVERQQIIGALEKTGWEAWKNRKTDGLEELISDKYVGFSSKDGRVDKSANIKGMATTNCTVNSYSWSDEQMNMVGPDVAVLTFKGDQDYTCDGKKGPTPVWSSSVYVRDGDKWRNQLYVENPVVDPKAAPPSAKKGEVAATETTPDALTEALMSVEKAAWEAWKVRDAKGVEGAMAKEFLNISGTGRRDRAASLKNWSEPKCEGLGYTFLEPKSVQLAPDVAHQRERGLEKRVLYGRSPVKHRHDKRGGGVIAPAFVFGGQNIGKISGSTLSRPLNPLSYSLASGSAQGLSCELR